MSRLILYFFFQFFALVVISADATAQVAVRYHCDAVNHWRVGSSTHKTGEVVGPGTPLRLETCNGWLALQYNQSGRVRVGELKERYENVEISRLVLDSFAGDFPNAGWNVRLNERVAIYMKGRGYLVYNEGLRWQQESNYSLANEPDIYQWELRSVPGAVQDHRKKEIRFSQEVSLFNVVKKKFLVYKHQQKKVDWAKYGG